MEVDKDYNGHDSEIEELAMNGLALSDWIGADSTHDTDGDPNASLENSLKQTVLYHGNRFTSSRKYWTPTDLTRRRHRGRHPQNDVHFRFATTELLLPLTTL